MSPLNGLVKELKPKEKKVQGETLSLKLKDILNEVITGVGNPVSFDLTINKKIQQQQNLAQQRKNKHETIQYSLFLFSLQCEMFFLLCSNNIIQNTFCEGNTYTF